jgi:hypothetical protein
LPFSPLTTHAAICLILLHVLSATLHVAGLQQPSLLPDVLTIDSPTTGVFDITLDASGSVLYVSNSYNAVFRLANTTTSAGGFPAAPELIAGNESIDGSGTTDGPARDARFHGPTGITYDTTNNIAYIVDHLNSRIRTLDLHTSNNCTVTTLAGSTQGYTDAIGTAAQFNFPYGIVYHHGSGMLYVAEYIINARVRRIVVATANVTTSAALPAGTSAIFICITNNGTFLYVTTDYIVVRVNVANGVVDTLAGTISSGGASFADGVGASARFSVPLGIALNTDESALIIVDGGNQRIRKLLLASNNVTTVAGSGGIGIRDGPALNATFNNPYGAKWHCNATAGSCGVLVADSSNSAMRFVSLELDTTPTAAASNATATASLARTRSRTASGSPVSATPSPTRSAPTVAASSTAGTATGPTTSAARSTSYAATPSRASFSLSADNSTSPSRPTESRSITRRTLSPSPTLYCALGLPPDGGSILPLTHDAAPASAAVVLVLEDAAPAAPRPLVASAASVARALLLVPDLAFAVNLSLRLSGSIRSGRPLDDAWNLTRAVLNVLQDSNGAAVPLLTSDAPFTTAHTMIAGRQQFTAVFLSAPTTNSSSGTPRWLPESLSTFRATTLAITLVWRCPTDPRAFVSILLQVPCPGEAQPLASEVKAAGTAAQYSASLAGPASGGAVGRVAAVRSLVLCSGDTVAEGLLPLMVVVCNGTRDDAGVTARGAIVGNLALWAAACLLMAAVAAAYAHIVGVRKSGSVVALGLPSPLLPLLTATVPSTASATFYLLQRRDVCAPDGAIAAVGVAMCVVPIAAMALIAYVVPRELRLVRGQEPSEAGHLCAPQRLRPLLSLLFHRRVRWCDMMHDDPTGGAATPSGSWLRRCATVVLLDYAAVWYACADVAVLTVACLLGSVSALGSMGACRVSAIALLLLYGGLAALCAATRPFTTLFSHVYALTSLCLSTAAVACQVWYLFGVNADLDALRPLLTAAAVCDLLVAGISVAKTVVDVADALRACRRHAIAVQRACREAAAIRRKAAATLQSAELDTAYNAVDGCQSDGVAALLSDKEVAPPMFDDDAFLFLALDEGGQFQDADWDGVATTRVATVRDPYLVPDESDGRSGGRFAADEGAADGLFDVDGIASGRDGIVTAREATVRDVSDLMRLYGQS